MIGYLMLSKKYYLQGSQGYLWDENGKVQHRRLLGE
jgi:hypothetical protein